MSKHKSRSQSQASTPYGWDVVEPGPEQLAPVQEPEPNETFWSRARNDHGRRNPRLAVDSDEEQGREYTRTLRRLIGSTAMVLLASLPTPSYATGRSAQCQPITINGKTVMAKPTKSGFSLAGCGMRITLDVTDAVAAPGGFEVSGKVSDLKCTVKVSNKTLTTAGKLEEAVQACVDSMHHATERGKGK